MGMDQSVICQISKKNNQPAFHGDSSILVHLFSSAMNSASYLDWRHFEEEEKIEKEKSLKRKKKKGLDEDVLWLLTG